MDPHLSSAFGTESKHQKKIINTESDLQQLPVDAQVASKAVHEKRKRNADAAHRFRQRRKEKEAGTAENISSLEQQIKKIEEEKDFLRAERDHYREERDFFRDVANRTPSQALLLPRPLSPRQRHTPFDTIGYGCIRSESRSEGKDTRGFFSTPSQSVLMTSAFAPNHGHRPRDPLPPRPFKPICSLLAT